MNAPLLSIPKLCDAGCKAEFKQHCVIDTDSNGAVVLKGGRDPATNIWTVNLDSIPTNNNPAKKSIIIIASALWIDSISPIASTSKRLQVK